MNPRNTNHRLRLALLAAVCIGASTFAEPPKFRIAPSPTINEAGQPKVSEEAQRLANQALASLAKDDLKAAKKTFRKVLELAPGNVATTINLGLVEYRQKNLPEAAQLLTQAVRKDPEAGLGWLILGVIEYDRGRLDHALAALAQAAVLEPQNALAHHYLGVTIGRKGWYLGAEDEMRKAIALEPDYADAHYNLAVFYLQRNPPAIELARRHYQKALDLGAAADPAIEKGLTPPKD